MGIVLRAQIGNLQVSRGHKMDELKTTTGTYK